MRALKSQAVCYMQARGKAIKLDISIRPGGHDDLHGAPSPRSSGMSACGGGGCGEKLSEGSLKVSPPNAHLSQLNKILGSRK